jgi:ribonuclease P protein component
LYNQALKRSSISTQKFTLGKDQRLKSRKLIERVFREGKSFALFPFRVFYLPGALAAHPLAMPPTAPAPIAVSAAPPVPADQTHPDRPRHVFLQAGFGAGNRNFKKAVDRNRIKRLTREAYRLQKHPLEEHLREGEQSLAVFFIYVGKELPDYAMVTEKIGVALKKLLKLTGHGR